MLPPRRSFCARQLPVDGFAHAQAHAGTHAERVDHPVADEVEARVVGGAEQSRRVPSTDRMIRSRL